MQPWPRRLSALLGTSLVIPIAGEFVISSLYAEQGFDMGRALAFVGVLGGGALLLLLADPRRLSMRAVIAAQLIVSGIAVSALGFLITVSPALIDDETASDVTGAATLCVGLFVLSAGVLLAFQLPGGAARAAEPAPEPEGAVSSPEQEDPTHLTISRFPAYSPEAHRGVLDLCRATLHTSDLHYLAYYVRGRPVVRLDLLDHPALRRFHGLVTPRERRATYERHGKTVERLLGKLDREFRDLDTGVLIRLVLDVERGALYYFLVDQKTDRFLIGVTLDQAMVHVADSKLHRLVDDLRELLGFPRVPDLER